MMIKRVLKYKKKSIVAKSEIHIMIVNILDWDTLNELLIIIVFQWLISLSVGPPPDYHGIQFLNIWRSLIWSQMEVHNSFQQRIIDLNFGYSLKIGDPLTGPPYPIGPPSHCHWSPSHWSPNSLVPQYTIGAHWSPIPLVLHITGPPSHWSPFSLVTPSSTHPNGPPSHSTTLVPRLIGSPSYWSPNSSVPHPIGPPISTTQSIGPPSHWSPILLVPQRHPGYIILIGPSPQWLVSQSRNANCVTRVILGDQWDGGPMEWVVHGC